MSNNIFSSTLNLTRSIGEKSNASSQLLDYLKFPEHFLSVSFPVTMDNGEIKYFKGYRSRYSTVLGPAKGGIRFHKHVDENLVNALALWMTLKTSLVSLPYGGGKGGVIVDPKTLSKNELERLSRAYLKAIYKSIGQHVDIPASDIGTNQIIMAHMSDEYERILGEKVPGIITGKPVSAGGSLFRKEATGYGVFYIIEQTVKKLNKKPNDLTVAIQGMGNVGYFAANFLHKQGYKIIAVSDHTGALLNENGLNIEEILNEINKGLTIDKIPDGIKNNNTIIDNEQLLAANVDILVLAAIDNVVTEENMHNINSKIIIEGANGPISPEAESYLSDKEVIIQPDILSNAGGVIVSYFEWVQNIQVYPWSEEKVIKDLERILLESFNKVWNYAEKNNLTLKEAAYIIALQRIDNALTFTRK